MSKPFTPDTLAERWECSPRHIRDMINRGQLPAFRLGKLVRISAESVQRIEECGLSNIGDTGAQLGSKKVGPSAGPSGSPAPKVVSAPNAP
ncbi:hypothetical protein C0V82_16345 [Niveispirillum cyanobacteriorum]|uniref:Helix-turn-helix domain-containing protein n=1 Tax=Niveispirillum cyanobacteriorum TaxID=1612173 RepID=A0A2K9NFZ4_9PROT|nr:hypothetical protein C0V82_16345 [Niveispirillum cyanobacteriorum]